MTGRRITTLYLDSLRPGKDNGEVVVDPGTRGRGALIMRVTDTGKLLYYRYFFGGKRRFELVGHFDPRGARAWREGERTHKGGRLTLAAAREGYFELVKLATAAASVGKDLKDHFAGEARAREVEKRAEDDKRRVGTFDDLLTVYVDALRAAGKVSADECERTFERNVRAPFRALLDRRANEINPDDIQTILARMVARGITRQVNILRSYLRAAFAKAGGAHDLDPRRLAANKKAFRLAWNPVALVPRIDEYDRRGERILAPAELRFYVEKIGAIANPVLRGFLRLHLLTGAQRPMQLLRALWIDYDLDEGLLALTDTKGRAKAREHLVPLLPEAVELLRELRPLTGDHEWPFTLGGRVPIRIETVIKAVAEVSAALVEEGRKHRIDVQPFTLRDLRRNVETALAELGISREVRAYLLSHGRGDKIADTYDKHHYLPEKRRALEAWWGYVQTTMKSTDKVVPIRRSRRPT
jgi:integrase